MDGSRKKKHSCNCTMGPIEPFVRGADEKPNDGIFLSEEEDKRDLRDGTPCCTVGKGFIVPCPRYDRVF